MSDQPNQTTKPAVGKKPLKFVVIGVANTVLDFAIMNTLVLFGVNAIVANTISTGIAMTFSFVMNKKWTFDSKSNNYVREIVLFFVFTLFGLWVIQNGIIWLLVHHAPHFGLGDGLFLNVAKLIASPVSLTWNYLTYDRFVFTNKKKV